MVTKKRKKIFLVFLFIVFFVTGSIILINSNNPNGDADCRILMGIWWKDHPKIITEGVWLPLHFYLIGLSLIIKNSPTYTPRLISLIFGSLAIFSYYWLVKELFGKKVAVLSTILFSILPLHLILSVESLSEVPFAFFLLLCLDLFFLYERTKKKLLLVISGLFLSAACALRYEGWFMVPWLPLMALKYVTRSEGESKKIMTIGCFVLPSLLFPSFWILGNYLAHQDPIYFLTATHEMNRSLCFQGNLLEKILMQPRQIASQFSPLVSILVALGSAKAIRQKQHRFMLGTATIILSFLVYETLICGLNPFNIRYIYLPTLFLIPYIAYLLPKNHLLYNLFSFLIIAVTAFNSVKIIRLELHRDPFYVNQVAQWLKDNQNEDTGLVLDQYEWESFKFLLKSGVREEKVFLVDINFSDQIIEREVLNYLQNFKQSYYVYHPRGKIASQFISENHSKTKVNERYRFSLLSKLGEYRIYKISSP